MPFFSAQVSLAAAGGATEDVNVNSFYIENATTPTNAQVTSWKAALDTFYDELVNLGALRGRAVAGHVEKFYAEDGSVPNYPFAERSMTLASTPGAVSLPTEVNLCVSYANDTANSVPRGRRRGRIYLGGWLVGANDLGRPGTNVYPNLANMFATYVEAVNDIAGFRAVVYSRSNITGYAIQRVWVDNDWDTMRSRGRKSTARGTVLITP